MASPSTSLGPVQPLGLTKTIAGQRGHSDYAADARVLLNRVDSLNDLIERRSHLLMHQLRLMPFDKHRIVAVAV